MKLQANLVVTRNTNHTLRHTHFSTRDIDPFCRQSTDNILRSDGTIELILFTHFDDDGQCVIDQLFDACLGGTQFLIRRCLKFTTATLEDRSVHFVGLDCFTLREEKVACKARLDHDLVAEIAQIIDSFK